MRTYWRQRNDLVRTVGRHIPRIQAHTEDADANEYPVGSDGARGSGLSDHWHGGEVAEVG
jgi:hypothetical protein